MNEWGRSLRAIGRHPGVAAMVVLTLALGIGANTAIFSAVDGVLLRPLPYQDSDRLVALFQHEVHKGGLRNPTSPADFLAWAKGTATLDRMTAAHPWGPVLTGRGQPEPVAGLKATPSLFELLGARAALGHVFGDTTSMAADGAVVVLSHRLWQRRFGGDPRIVGQALVLDGQPYTVLGVMPPAFQFPPFWATGAEMWTPLRLTAESETDHAQFLRVFARRRAGATLVQARAEMDLIARRLATEWPASNTGIGVNVEALHDPVVSRVRPALLVLFMAVAFVLLIACANVASLLLAQGLGREKEVALRAALGAGRGRIVRELLAENVALALLGGLLGLWLASRGLQALRLFGPEGFPRLDEIRLDGRVATFNLLLSVLTGIVSGILPALRASRTDLASTLKQGDRVAGAGRHRLHDLLVVGEFGLALVLLIGAGLMAKSFLRLLHPDPGFRAEGVLTMSVSFSSSPMRESAPQNAFFDEVLRRTRAVPGVETAALVNHLPITGDTWGMEFAVEGQTPPVSGLPSAVYRAVTPDYLRSLGIPLLGGRTFGDPDRADTAPVVLVNQTLARRFWPGAAAVGQRIRAGGGDSQEPWLTVVGVIGDARQASLTEPVRPEILFPYTQNPVAWYRSTTLVVRTTADPLAVAEPVKAVVRGLDGSLPVTNVRSMAQILSDSVGQERFNAALLGGFAATALLLATVGIYGVMAYTVTRRRQEIAIRMALGARASEVFALIVGRGLLLGGLGATLGLAGALTLSRFLGSLLFEVAPTDPATFAGLTALLMAVSLLACAVPALRAARVDPLVALRNA